MKIGKTKTKRGLFPFSITSSNDGGCYCTWDSFEGIITTNNLKSYRLYMGLNLIIKAL